MNALDVLSVWVCIISNHVRDQCQLSVPFPHKVVISLTLSQLTLCKLSRYSGRCLKT